ncbi:MAG: hypothetical protein JW904_05725 [Spirochaetales bacterium]|nr:hypothetical protein [Spirochaetales bacterium]
MSIYDLVAPLGIATILLVLITAFLGLRTHIAPAKMRRKLHIIFAVIAITVALVHGGIVLYTKFFA